jgi:6-phosphogluconolactonase (cycloisomerase 2 family)
MRRPHRPRGHSGLAETGALIALLSSFAAASPAWSQSDTAMLFVANNGNLEGSVTAFRVDEGGELAFANRIVTGTRTSTSQPCAGCNATSIAVSPDGRFVAASHAAGNDPNPDGISIFEVAADGSIALRTLLPLVGVGTPLDIVWTSEVHVAVTRTDFSGSSVATYRFVETSDNVVLVDTAPCGAFNSSLAFDPAGRFLFGQDSFGATVYAWFVEPNGTLVSLGTASSGGIYPLGLGLSPDGRFLYAGGGISGGGEAVVAFDVADGLPSLLPKSPFTSPGESPKQVVVSPDGAFAFAAHGGDGTIRGFARDGESGGLAATGVSFEVGGQGGLGEIATLGGFLYATDRDTFGDGVRGVRVLEVTGNGDLLAVGEVVSTEGVTPNGLAAWAPLASPCPADLDGDGQVGAGDLTVLLAAWGERGPADLDGDGHVEAGDLATLLAAWGPC